jgi:hypothetical protein
MTDDDRSTDRKLTLEWVQQPDGSRALVFDAKTWTVFDSANTAKGETAQHVISASVATCFAEMPCASLQLRLVPGPDISQWSRFGQLPGPSGLGSY